MAVNPESFARDILEKLKEGAAPWVKPWKPNYYLAQHNPVTGTIYKGVNLITLSMTPYEDPRWVTFRQASERGWSVRKGEHGHPILFFSTTRVRVERDEDGKPVKDENGETVKQVYHLQKPVFTSATVFNAEQVEGMPPIEPMKPEGWNPHGRAEEIVKNCGVPIFHDQADRAFYRPSEDTIHMPERGAFDGADGYYATLLHEIGHSTGHESRFDRNVLNAFGSDAYAREELNAEIASWMLGLELGIGHDPSQHTAYIASWIRYLEEKPTEIFSAARTAQRICDTVLSMEHSPVDWDELRRAFVKTVEPKEVEENASGRTYLDVSYKQRKEAKKLGAVWDPNRKSWYAPEGVDLEPLKKFWKEVPEVTPVPAP